MRIWMIGAGRGGAAALRQLRKNEDIEVIVSDPQERPAAVTQGLIKVVHYVERITPVNVNDFARRIRPDLILITAGAGSQSYGNVTGGTALAEALNYEISQASEYPCLVLSRSNLI